MKTKILIFLVYCFSPFKIEFYVTYKIPCERHYLPTLHVSKWYSSYLQTLVNISPVTLFIASLILCSDLGQEYFVYIFNGFHIPPKLKVKGCQIWTNWTFGGPCRWCPSFPSKASVTECTSTGVRYLSGNEFVHCFLVQPIKENSNWLTFRDTNLFH